MKKIFLIFIITTMTACASNGDKIDPYENMNRKVFKFNQAIDQVILDPVASTYNVIVPQPARSGIRNALDNLREPMTFANDILQFKPKRAVKTLSRFVINSTLGMAGLMNPADKMGIKRHTEDIGQTLAVWGFKDSHYLVLPFMGPSTPRDTIGFTASIFLDPTDYVIDKNYGAKWVYIKLGADVITLRASLDKILDDLYQEQDPYLFTRSAYLQSRNNAIRDGKEIIASTDDDDMFFDDLDDEEQELFSLIQKNTSNKKKKAAKK